MKKRTLAIAASLAALGFAAAPIAASAATSHSNPRHDRVEHAGTARDRSVDRSSKDRSVDTGKSSHDSSSRDRSNG